MIPLTDTIAFDDREIEERFVRAAGPGGKNITRDASAVELRVDVGAATLPPDVKRRLVALAGRRVTKAGILVILGRADESQARNRAAARRTLVALLKRAARSPKSRRAMTLAPGVREDRLLAKHRHSAIKQARGRPADD